MKYIIIIALLAILYASNPSLEDHQNAVKEKISKIIKSQIPTDEKTTSTVGEIGTAIGTLFGNSVLESIAKEVVKKKGLLLFFLN